MMDVLMRGVDWRLTKKEKRGKMEWMDRIR